MGLRRVLGAADATWLVAGAMVGAGIFYTPGLVAERLPGLLGPLIAWALGGALALCGAMVYAELGARLPRAGGDYRYLARAFGPLWGFLSGWAAFTVTFSAAVAAMVLVALDYLLRAASAELSPAALRAAAVVLVLALTAANLGGARLSGKVTALFTALPIAALLALYGFGLLAGNAPAARPAVWSSPAAPWPLALAAALIPVYFTYTGWNAAAYVAGEIRDPGRNLARALIGGTLLVTLLYVAINAVLLVVVPQQRLAGSTTAGAEAARLMLGGAGERALSLVIAFAVLGTANVTLMAGSRIYFAMAEDGLAPAALARINRHGAPGVALASAAVWTAALAALGDVQALVNWTTLAILLLSSLTVAGLFVLRRRDGREAAFRCPGYPVTPLLYLAASLGVAVASGLHDPLEAGRGLLLVASGLPAYLLLRRPAAPAGSSAPAASSTGGAGAVGPESGSDSPR